MTTPQAPEFRALGLNLNGTADYTTDFFFANAIQNGCCWAAVGAPYAGTGVSLGTDGLPTDDSSIILSSVAPGTDGRYTITFTGRALGTTATGQPDPTNPAGGVAFL